jgi:hypothetical protein
MPRLVPRRPSTRPRELVPASRDPSKRSGAATTPVDRQLLTEFRETEHPRTASTGAWASATSIARSVVVDVRSGPGVDV